MPGRHAAPGGGIPYDVVVVAAGESRRMAGTDKLWAPLGGVPLIRRTLEVVAAVPEVRRIAVVAAPSRVEELAGQPWLPDRVETVVAGGSRRQESVAAGIDALAGPEDAIVLIHDAARPLATAALFRVVAAAVDRHGAAIPVLPVAETLKRLDGDAVGETVDRSHLGAAQTPQGFRRELLLRAYAEHPPAGPLTWTDEAALMEVCRIPVHAVPGDPMNIKVTLPDDLAWAEAALIATSRAGEEVPAGRAPGRGTMRVGLGHDSHPFGPGMPLALGGLLIEDAPRLHGHSDGDVVLHAVADALLGAAGLGDLGALFPAGPATPKGVSSRELLAGVVRVVNERDLRPASLDLTIVGARPRLAGRLAEMRSAIAELLGVGEGSVNVKASTGNLGGREGAGRGIAAEAVVLLESAR